jgi:hypothetical protein
MTPVYQIYKREFYTDNLYPYTQRKNSTGCTDILHWYATGGYREKITKDSLLAVYCSFIIYRMSEKGI